MEVNDAIIEWMEKRCGRFTASKISDLFQGGKKKDEYFGKGAQTYIRIKVAEILTMQSKEESDFKQTEWGKLYEPLAVQVFEKAIGKTGLHYGVLNPVFFEYGEYAGGSPDWETTDQKEGAEIKCPYNSSEHLLNLTLTSADFKDKRWDYYCQGQMNMHIRNWEVFHFVSYDPRMVEEKYRLKIIKVYPDLEWQAEFKERLAAAVAEVQSMIGLLAAQPVVAEYSNELNAMLIS